MTDKLTRVEMAFRLGWWLHDEAVPLDQVVQKMYNLSQDEYDCLDSQVRAEYRRRARHLLQQGSRVLPIIEEDGTWQAIEATPPRL